MKTQVATPLLPLCVDLDGTLTRTDLLLESFARLVKTEPWMLFAVPFWLFAGKAPLKRNLSRRVSIDVTSLPYNENFIEWLQAERDGGRDIYLVTAADETVAKEVAAYLGLFRGVLASDGEVNLKGKQKAKALQSRFAGEFIYAGNSRADIEVWRGCRGAVVVNAIPSVVRHAGQLAPLVKVFEPEGRVWRYYLKAMRPHQWAKNLLIYVPLVTSHQLIHPELVLRATLGAALFGICSSAQYIINDIIDLESDRRHTRKRLRPFASGQLSIGAGLALAPALLAVAIGGGFLISSLFAALLALYFCCSLAYSLVLKRIVILDVFILAALYTFRIVVGHVATRVAFSEWLLSFSVFLFLSLALSKRATELRGASSASPKILGRGYQARDIAQVNIFGVCSAFLSAVVFMQYLQSEKVREMYRTPEVLWVLSPIFLYWVSRLWMISSRGDLHEDPVLFVLKDRVTYLLGVVVGLIMIVATVAWTKGF